LAVTFQGTLSEVIDVNANITGAGAGETAFVPFTFVSGSTYTLSWPVQTGWTEGVLTIGVCTDETSGNLDTRTFQLVSSGPNFASITVNGNALVNSTTIIVDASSDWVLSMTFGNAPTGIAVTNASFLLVPMVDLSGLGIAPPSSTISMGHVGMTYSMSLSQQVIGSFWQAGMTPATIRVFIRAVNSLGIPSGVYYVVMNVTDTKSPPAGESNMDSLTSQVLDPAKEYEVTVNLPVPEGASSIRKVLLLLASESSLKASAGPDTLAGWQALPGVQTVELTLVSGDEWMGMIPQQEPGVKLYWAIYVLNYAGNSTMTVGTDPLNYSAGTAQTELVGGYVFLGLMAFGMLFAISYRVQQGVQTVKKAKKVAAPGKKAVAEKAAPGAGKKTPISKDIPTKICPICKARIGADLGECPYCHKKFDSI
jgi:hypothetical protein